MKNRILRSIALATLLVSFTCCQKEEANCYDCTDCQGQYGHLINGEYCVEGFDNRSDWEEAKSFKESNDGCTCIYQE